MSRIAVCAAHAPIDLSTKEVYRGSETIQKLIWIPSRQGMFKARSQGQSIDRPVCGESFCQKQSNTAGSPSNVQISLCEPPALPYQQCTCIGVSMRERKHSPALRWTELLRSVPNICCGDLGNFRPYGSFQSSFAVSPLLELQQQRETVRFVLPSALNKGTSTTDTDGDMPPGWLRSHSLQTPRKPSRPVTATRFYERQQTAADSRLWGPVIQHSMVNSATPDAPWKSPAMCARRIIQTVFARSKFIARWTVNTFIWGPVRFLVVVVIRKTDSFQPSDSSSKVSNSTTRPSQAASVSLSLMHYCLQEDLFPLLGFDQEHDLPEFGIFWEDPASAPTSLVTQVSIFYSLRCSAPFLSPALHVDHRCTTAPDSIKV